MNATMSNKKIVGLAGSICLALGTFAPIISVPFSTLNYVNNGSGDGIFVLFLAAVSAIAILISRYRFLWFTGITSLALIAMTFFSLSSKISGIQERVRSDLAGNPFRGIGILMTHTVQLQWGWLPLIVGGVLIVVCVLMSEVQTQEEV
ncbi:hypothetical protein COW49_01285 [Candidatus Kaiserbacteria bacterium CG17_big_fil_post_rev_8_21_14_2_50_51_7]|uniref:Uncharacterized protein n=1 Tax=Candidatus Kaiserbacteria bacterium CG17_big_fil_post_rev_8_21_14_2_50_51_7 TaxID=1974613 RepID=A0A2M7FCC9_9BACT|nr:MAG: hypothetical protein COW49_01285 [Candidatus Kaiserbacteria bacterium CG17_big_fil_post_rev_8_21_14_2_50_51_7]